MSLSSQVEDMEEELASLESQLEDNECLRSEMNDLEEDNARLNDDLDQWRALQEYIEDNHPEIITAFLVTQRMETA